MKEINVINQKLNKQFISTIILLIYICLWSYQSNFKFPWYAFIILIEFIYRYASEYFNFIPYNKWTLLRIRIVMILFMISGVLNTLNF